MNNSSQHFTWCTLHMLSKQGDSIQPWCIPFPILDQSVVPYPVLLLLDLCTDFAGKVAWYSHFLNNFPQIVMIHTVKAFSIVSEGVVDVLLEFSCFFYDSADVDNLISGSSVFSKSSLNIWKFWVHVLLKLNLKNFERYLANMWSEAVVLVWTFFGIALLWNCIENWPFSNPVFNTDFSKY